MTSRPRIYTAPPTPQGCPACGVVLREGDLVDLVVLGPGDDPVAQADAAAGRPYNAVAVAVHWACAGGKP